MHGGDEAFKLGNLAYKKLKRNVRNLGLKSFIINSYMIYFHLLKRSEV